MTEALVGQTEVLFKTSHETTPSYNLFKCKVFAPFAFA